MNLIVALIAYNTYVCMYVYSAIFMRVLDHLGRHCLVIEHYIAISVIDQMHIWLERKLNSLIIKIYVLFTIALTTVNCLAQLQRTLRLQ